MGPGRWHSNRTATLRAARSVNPRYTLASKQMALQIDRGYDDCADHDGVDPVAMKDGDLGDEGADIDGKQDNRAEHRDGWQQERDGARELQSAGKVTEPLSEA